MINVYILGLITFALIASIVRASLLKSFYIGVMSSIFSMFLVALMAYVSLFQGFIFVSDFPVLKVIISGIAIVGMVISLVSKDRKAIVNIVLSNVFFIFNLCILPILVIYNASSNADTDYILHGFLFKNILWISFLCLFYYSIMILNVFLGRTNGINSSNVYLKDIKNLEKSNLPEDQKRYSNHKRFLYSIENTFYPISYYGLFVVAVLFIGFSSMSYTNSNSYIQIKSMLYRDLSTTESSFMDDYDNFNLYYSRDDEATDVRIYDTCVIDKTLEVETCIDTRSYSTVKISNNVGLYFESKKEIYYYEDEVITRLFDYDEMNVFGIYYLYKLDGKVYLETDDFKWELNGNTATVMNEFESINDLGKVLIRNGHVLISSNENTTLIDGIEYDIDTNIDSIQFFEDMITDGQYEFKDGEVLNFSDHKSYLYNIDGEYYRKIGDSIFDLFVNVKDEYDVIRITDHYMISKRYITDQDDNTYIGTTLYSDDHGLKINFQAHYYNVNFSVFWMFALYLVLSGLYFAIRKETYRIR
ncbi:hypothetical protein KQ51_01238 [Candidatus Izimaplasma bacterium HR1]|jgi:hypothetical protein|uniref:hypothetical protein n=1 Tax=Candidatus Izimoplasma sp. HR1 TaxID=1541959 RepID=UPI0004F82DAE|nr:hypothetical protein KQ51_01238 [Candidatus Izimaplasma bacterium HR1]